MASNSRPDEIRLSSRDLEILVNGGNIDNLNLDLLDPATAQQIQQLMGPNQRPAQSTPSGSTTPVTVTESRPPSNTGRSNQTRGTRISGPYVEIVEQPKARGLRFRYECEGRSAGSIPGENSSTDRKTFPTIKIHNYSGPAVIVVSCVTKDEPYKPHPHNLVGKDCKKGVCTLRVRDTNTISFPHLGIQCAKKKDVDNNLKMRQEINVDPYQTGFKHKGQNIDLNVVRLCFQVFLPDENGRITRIVAPVVSQPIHDKKALNDLIICRVDRMSGKPKGGDEIFLLCEKINRDDVRVRFYEERDGILIWEDFGDFGQNDVHRQFAIVFKSPPYKDQYLLQPVDVQLQLQRISDSEGSDPITFTYQPEDPDPERICEKRKRKAAGLSFLQPESGSAMTPEMLKQRLKLKATRTSANRKQEPMAVKQEVTSPGLPQYSFTNTGAQMTQSNLSNVMATSSPVPVQFNPNQMDVTASTIASQAGMSGGKIQYTQPTPQPQQQQPQPNPISSLNLNNQLLQLLASAGAMQQPAQQAVPQQQQPMAQQSYQQNFQPTQSPQAPEQSTGNPQSELLKQILGQLIANQAQNVNPGVDNSHLLTNHDPNLQDGQNQEMNSLGSVSLDHNLLQSLIASTGGSEMISLESLEGLSGLANIEFDPTVAGFETVGGDGTSSQQYDETSAAVQNLNG